MPRKPKVKGLVRGIRTNRRSWYVPTGATPRVEILAQSLASFVPEGCETIIACGCVRLLHWYVFQRMTDKVNGFEALEQVLGWSGKKGDLGKAMLSCGYLAEGKDGMYCPTALGEMPADVLKRWTSFAKPDLLLAERRAIGTHVMTPEELVKATALSETLMMTMLDEHMEQQLDLFGNRPQPEDLNKVEPQKDMRELIGHWLLTYRSRYGHDYPLNRIVETAFLKRIRGACKSTAEAKQLLSHFLRCSEPYFTGHPLGRLASNTQTLKLLTELRARGATGNNGSKASTQSGVVKLAAETASGESGNDEAEPGSDEAV